MTRKDGPAQPAPYPAEKARSGTIVLRTPLRRAVFIAGLAGTVLLLAVLALAAWH